MDAATVDPASAPPTVQPTATPAAETAPDYRTYAEQADAADLGKAERPRAAAVTEPAKADPPAAVTPATDDDAPAVDAKGQPVRGSDGKFVSKRQQAINDKIRDGVERGIAQERAERERLERELADLRRGAPTAKPEQAAAAQPAVTLPAKPKMADFEAQIGTTYDSYAAAVEAYQDARETWRDEVAAQTAEHERTKAAETAAERRANDIIVGHLEREQAILATVPNYFEKTQPLRVALDAGLKAGAPLALPLLESPISERLLLHFADHLDELSAIGTLGETNLPAALRALGKLEAALESSAAPPAAPAAPPKRTVSAAPAPPQTLGTRPAEPADRRTAALSRKDFTAYAAEADREDLARFGRR